MRFLFVIIAALSFACSGSKPAAVSTLEMILERDSSTSPNSVVLKIFPRNSKSEIVSDLEIKIEASSGKVSEVKESNEVYTASILPEHLSGEIQVTATASVGGQSVSVSKTAVVLPNIHSSWGQPQMVPGLVNTSGYEDGAEVSPDGEFLIVSSYSPVDMACCVTGCGVATPLDSSSSFCQTVKGPYQTPERPEMPGAERIVSATRILNSCPQLCVDAESTSLLLIPTSSYLFARQSDGSFANPKVIGVDGGGCLPSQGFSFTKNSTSTNPQVIFAFDFPGGANEYDIYLASITPNAQNNLARFYCDAGNITFDAGSNKATQLGLGTLTGDKGNPSLGSGVLFFDSEKVDPNILKFSTYSGDLATATFASPQALTIGNTALSQRQPFFHKDRLYFAQVNGSSRILSSLLAASSESQIEIAPEANLGAGGNRAGAIVEIGEPSLSNRSGEQERLYFVYYIWTGSGFNAQVGFVEKIGGR